jgi:hypothetical protein
MLEELEGKETVNGSTADEAVTINLGRPTQRCQPKLAIHVAKTRVHNRAPRRDAAS